MFKKNISDSTDKLLSYIKDSKPSPSAQHPSTETSLAKQSPFNRFNSFLQKPRFNFTGGSSNYNIGHCCPK